MIYELRMYESGVGRMADLQTRFRDHTTRLFERHGIEDVGYWTTDVGPSNRELTYLLAFEDAGHRERAWAEFKADPEWQQVAAESNADGQLVTGVVNRLLVPTDFSKLG
jgi:hypothetical protein